jgi:hypothetical protein
MFDHLKILLIIVLSTQELKIEVTNLEEKNFVDFVLEIEVVEIGLELDL